jgi:cellulose synthase/poly-beta-1,6-N-acetylglucosamine synthase-like glycosyltransferase
MDFLVLQGITAAAVSSGLHTLCNGANLGYQATAFKNVGGFEGIDRIATGDDMLLMYKIKQQDPEKVLYLRSHDAVVSTSALPTWRSFLEQRKRWASKTPVYQDRKVQAILMLVFLLHLMFPVLLLAGISDPVFFWYALGLLVVKTIIEFPFVYSVSRFFGEERLMPLFPLFQPLHIVYTIVVGILSQLGKYEWKGRKTK